MSGSPMVPGSLETNLKSFWSRPEGKTGGILLVVAGIGLLAAWKVIVPLLVSMLVDTLHLAFLAIALGALLWVLFSEKSHLIFRLFSRWLTGLIINLDPLAIRRDYLLQAKKKQDSLSGQIGSVRGSVQTLKDILTKNKQTIENDMAMAEEAKRRMATAHDAAEKLRMQYEMQLKTNEVGRMQKSNESYQALLKTISDLYDRLVRVSAGIDFFIADLEGSIKEEEVKNRTIKKAWSAFSTAWSILKGSAGEQDIYDRAAEVLVEQDSMRLGQIEDFTRLSQHFLDGVDLQNGVMNTQAAAALDAYEQKLLTSGNLNSVALVTGGGTFQEKVPVESKARLPGDDYFKI